MNNTIDFKRFGQVLAKDWKSYFRNFGISLIVWSCIPVLFWIVTLIFDIDMENGSRAAVIGCLVFSVLMFVPSKVYGKANLSREGVDFATLPATNLEKFFSMVLYCSVLTPLIVGMGSWAIDSLLYLLPFGGFSYFFVVLPKSHLGMQLVTIGSAILLFSSIFLFGNMVFFDGRKYIRNFGLTLAILCGLNLVLWILTLIFDFTMPTLPRYLVIYLAVFLAIMMVPAKAFGDINLSREGVRYAMLPASNLEKYLSYVLFCLMTPVVVVFGSWLVDALLTLVPFGGFDHYIRHFGFTGMMHDFFFEIGELTEEDLSGEGYMTYQNVMNIFGPAYNLSVIIGVFFSIGLFMFGNLLFKTHKTVKTLAVMIGVSYVMSMIMQVFFVSQGFFPWMNEASMGVSADPGALIDFASGAMTFSNILNAILTIALYVGLFFKLKTQKY